MAADIGSVDASDDALLDRIVQLIAAQQARPERNIVYVGVHADGIRAELDALSPAWTDTLRVVGGDEPVALTLAEWDEQLGRAWVFGPWIDGDDATWDEWAPSLVASQLEQVPATITSFELGGTVEHERLRRLAGDLGWASSAVNHAYVFAPPAGDVALPPDDDGLRGVVPEDHGLIAPLHDSEFPATYFSAQQLIERAASGEHVVLVATTDDGHFAGYAAGRVQPDGGGFIDFVAVEPSARGGGVGRRLVSGLVGRLLPMSPTGEVHLTVQTERAPARALYTALGFREDIGFVGYRSPPP